MRDSHKHLLFSSQRPVRFAAFRTFLFSGSTLNIISLQILFVNPFFEVFSFFFRCTLFEKFSTSQDASDLSLWPFAPPGQLHAEANDIHNTTSFYFCQPPFSPFFIFSLFDSIGRHEAGVHPEYKHETLSYLLPPQF